MRNNKQRKITSLFLVLFMVLMMSVPAMAAAKPKISNLIEYCTSGEMHT